MTGTAGWRSASASPTPAPPPATRSRRSTSAHRPARPRSRIRRRALAAYDRIALRPDQSHAITVHVPLRQLQYWDTKSSSWITATGPRPLYIGGNERSAALAATITVNRG